MADDAADAVKAVGNGLIGRGCLLILLPVVAVVLWLVNAVVFH